MSRRRALALAVVVLAAAAFLALVAVDVSSWRGTMERDDLTYLAGSPIAAHWHVAEDAPFHAARTLIGVQDDVVFRRALRVFRLSRPRDSLITHPALGAARAQAQVALTQVLRTDRDPRRRSIAADLLGVLVFSATSEADNVTAASLLAGAVNDFQSAVKLDSTNEDAKYNLELSLLRQRAGRERDGEREQDPQRGREAELEGEHRIGH